MKFKPFFTAIAAVVLVLVQTGTALASSSSYSIQGTLAEENLSESVHGLVYEVDPGGVLHGEANVINSSNEAMSLDIYTVDAQIDSAGNFALKSTANEQIAVGDWIQLDQSTVSLEPRSSTLVTFTMAVPQLATPGQYAGGLVVTPSKSTEDGLSGSGLSLTSQIGLRVYLSVLGDVVTKLDWNNYDLAGRDAEMQKIVYDFSNEGNTLLDLSTTVEVDGLINDATNYDFSLGTVAPGEDISPIAKIDLPFLDILTVKSVVDYKISSAFSFDNSEVEAQSIEKEIKIYVIPWLYVGLLCSILALIAGFGIWRHKHNH